MPVSLPETMYLLSGVNEHSIKELSFTKFVILTSSVPLYASNTHMKGSEAPQIIISLLLENLIDLISGISKYFQVSKDLPS